jgi:RNA 2',3'-cyclic 3'-phosphodiesterase
MYRLFVAIDLPEEVKKTVGRISGELPGAHWVAADQLHLTLRFIGEVDEGVFRQVREALTGVSGSPFSLALKGIGHFPPGKYARVLWVGMEASEELLRLQEKVELALIDAGIAPDSRRFSPHITIARLKEAPAARILAFEERHGGFETPAFPVEVFHLYSSTLSREGAVHKREKTYAFK